MKDRLQKAEARKRKKETTTEITTETETDETDEADTGMDIQGWKFFTLIFILFFSNYNSFRVKNL